MRCSHLDGHRRRPPIAFLFVLVVLLLRCCFECLHSPRVPTFEKSPFHRTRASDVGAALPCLRPGFPILASRQSSWQIEASNRSRSKFADPRYRPRGRITKSVTVTTTYNRTILSGTAASAQYKMAKAALHLNENISMFDCGLFCCKCHLQHFPAIPLHLPFSFN